MYQSLLSVLLLGMVPAHAPLDLPVSSLSIPIAAPVMVSLNIEKRMSASGILVMDYDSGQVLYSKQSDVRRPMASLTKLMTAVIITENHSMDEVVTIPDWITRIEGTVAYLQPQQKYRVGDLLSAMLMASANDAAQALAVFHAGSVDAFVKEMNARAAILGLLSTSYANPSGLDHPNQWSTPRDMAWLTTFALKKPEISSRMRSRVKKIWSLEGNPIALSHTHMLLHENTPVVAGKTGTTMAAGQCLISVVEQDQHSYVVVLLNSLHRYGDMNTILARLVPPSAVVAGVSL